MPVPPALPSAAGGAEADDLVGLTVALGILQSDQKAAGRGRVVVVVAAAPGIGIDNPIRRHRKVSGMAEFVGENRGTETGEG